MPTSLPPPGKKRKTTKSSGLLQTVQNLETQLIEAATTNSSLNSLADLVGLLGNIQDPHNVSKVIYALYRVFVVIITTGKLTVSGGEDAKIVRTWIWDRLNSYIEFLVGLLKDEEKFLRVRLI
jgi:U3 small nucleolar RNA-associated protein 19